jgi:hypothetical protein
LDQRCKKERVERREKRRWIRHVRRGRSEDLRRGESKNTRSGGSKDVIGESFGGSQKRWKTEKRIGEGKKDRIRNCSILSSPCRDLPRSTLSDLFDRLKTDLI